MALPLAGALADMTGSYRVILLQGAAALLALVPLLRTHAPPQEEREGR